MRSALLVAVALAALCLAASALPSFPTSPWNLNIDGSGVESSVASWTTPSGQTLVYWTTFNGLVLAVDAASGVGAWFTSDVGEMIRSTPAVYAFNATNAAVYLVGGDAQLWCFDAATGAKIWSVPTGGKAQEYQASSPAVYGDTILFGSLDGNLKAVRAIDGAPVWQYSTGGTIYSSPHLGLESAAPGAKTLACIGTDAGGLHVVEAATGAPRWIKNTGAYVRGSCTFLTDAAVNNGSSIVYFGSNARHVYAVDAMTSLQLWIFTTPGGDDYATPALHTFANGTITLFVSCYDYNVYALDALSGTVRWSFATVGYVIATPLIYTLPSTGQARLYVGCDTTVSESFVYQLDASSGAQIAQAYVENAPVWSAARAVTIAATKQTLIMVGDQTGNVWAYYP